MSNLNIDTRKIKGLRREKQRFNKKRKWIKHGEGVWQKQVHLQNTWLSRTWKRKIGISSSKKNNKPKK